jgi:hypothetical protein
MVGGTSFFEFLNDVLDCRERDKQDYHAEVRVRIDEFPNIHAGLNASSKLVVRKCGGSPPRQDR